MRPKILLVEDDANLVELIRYNLSVEGFDLVSTADGEEALVLADEEKPDLVILDWMIESLPGIEVCRRLRRSANTGNIPILMLTARTEEADRVRGLETGADDYLTKPFSPRELVARIRAVLRRLRPALTGGTLAYAGIVMDTAQHKVSRDGKAVPIGPTEFRLLRHFLEHPERVFSREQLMDAVWGRDGDVEMRTVDVHIRRLRKAINLDDTLPDVVRTVRSAGYALQADAAQRLAS
jgi:two-component system, OmpR family, phosphate regulon response regulator PhoB